MTGMLSQWLTLSLMAIGSMFGLLAAVGIVRLPDLFTRMHAATKSATVGAICMLGAVSVHYGELAVATRAVLVILFLLLTAPIAAHMIARSAYIIGVDQWDGTIIDELEEVYGDTDPADKPVAN